MCAHSHGLRHSALLYCDADEFLAGTVAFVRDGLAADEAIMVALPAPNLELLRCELGADAGRVEFAEMEQFGRNPARLIPAWRDFAEGHAAAPGIRGIGEPIWAGRSPAEIDECTRHESLLNLAFADAGSWSLLCPYDVTRLDDDVLAGARRTHPVVAGRGGEGARAACGDPSADGGPFAGELESPPTSAIEMAFAIGELAALRRLVADEAQRAGLRRERVDDLVIAATEVATNGVRHGGGSGLARLWTDERVLACEINSGGRIVEPLAGRVRPPQTAIDGRGLWIANQLCDLVQIRSGERGTVVRLLMNRG